MAGNETHALLWMNMVVLCTGISFLAGEVSTDVIGTGISFAFLLAALLAMVCVALETEGLMGGAEA